MITVKGRVLTIPEEERYIGTPYDDNSEIRTFQIDRTGMNGVDLSALSFRLDLEYKGGKKDTALLTKTVDEEKIVLLWNITNGVLQEAGTLFVNIRATDTLGTVKWASFPAAMYVEKTIDTPGSYDGSLTELEQMEAEIDKKMEQMDAWADSIDGQETERQENEQVRQNQETERQKNEIEREKKTQEVINTFETAIGEAKDAAKLSESWAVGGTGTRDGEDGDNSKYYCSQSQAEADRAKEEADKAAAFSEIVPPVFCINWETMELIQETAATGIRFFLTEDKELCFEFTKEEQGGGEDAAADHMQIWKNKDDIQKNQTDIAALTDKTNTLAPGIVLGTKGGTITVSNASEQPLVGLTVYGKSTQASEPSVEHPQEILSAGDSGEINVNVLGKNLADVSRVTNATGADIFEKIQNGYILTSCGMVDRISYIPCKLKKGVKYTASFDIKYSENVPGDVKVSFYLPETQQYTIKTFIPTADCTKIGLYFDDAYTGKGCTAQITNLQVEIGSAATSYEPYKQPQTLTLKTPNGLPGIPVKSGGNYVDKNGQQWICDTIECRDGIAEYKKYQWMSSFRPENGIVFFPY